MSAIIVSNLSKSFGSLQALDKISFKIPEGSITGFLGPNGAGKTTTIKIMMQLVYQDSGLVEILGKDVRTSITEIKREVGIIPDADLPNLKAHSILRHSGMYAGISGQILRNRINELVKLIGATKFINRKTHTLSKGQRQRIKIANALMNDPKILIADEPTAGLDPVSRRQFSTVMTKLRREEGKTMLFSNHVMSEVEDICDNLIIINEGKIVTEGKLVEIKNKMGVRTVFTLNVDGIEVKEVQSLSGVISAELMKNGSIKLHTEKDEDKPRFILDLLSRDVRINSIRRGLLDLEDVFFEVVSK